MHEYTHVLMFALDPRVAVVTRESCCDFGSLLLLNLPVIGKIVVRGTEQSECIIRSLASQSEPGDIYIYFVLLEWSSNDDHKEDQLLSC
jgi:hypothetical protein